MEAYLPQGLSELKKPPPPFGLLQRSGFLTPRKPSAASARPRCNRPGHLDMPYRP